MLHLLDTQICEAINNALTFLAPKNKHFGRTESLEYRIGHVVGMHNEGQLFWFQSILDELGVDISDTMLNYLRSTDCIKSRRQEKQGTFDQRRKRAHGFAAKLKSAVLLQRTEGVTYETNTFVNGIVNNGMRN